MPTLSHIESEAMRRLGRMPEARRRALQQALVELCDAHRAEIRGPEPPTPLAHALWSVAPPRAGLLADLVAAGDARLHGLLGTNTARGFALLALAEVERGDAEALRLAHAPMMLFDTPAAGARYAAALQVVGLLASAEGGADPALEALRRELAATGVRFLGIDDDHVSLAVHGHPHAPVSARQLGEMLGEVRQAWLG